VLKIGRGVTRDDVARALRTGAGLTVTYDDVLSAEDVRTTVAGVRDAGSPSDARPLLAWLASHPSTPEDVLRELFEAATPEVLVALAMNRAVPAEIREQLLASANEDVRSYAAKTFEC
jgi:hypothetical protein